MTEELEEKVGCMMKEKDSLKANLVSVADSAGLVAPCYTIDAMNKELTPRMREWDGKFHSIKDALEAAGDCVRDKYLPLLMAAHAELDFHFGNVIYNTDPRNPNFVGKAAGCYRRAYKYDPQKEYAEAADEAGKVFGKILRGEL